jgi:hypothetical protein
LGSGKDGIFDRGIACAPAEGVLQRKPNIRTIRFRISLQQSVGGHDLPGDAESALHRAMLHERFLQWVKVHLVMDALRQTFDGDNLFSIRTFSGVNARHNRLTIHKDGTRAALSFVAANLCPRQTKSFAQESGKSFSRDGLKRILNIIYD